MRRIALFGGSFDPIHEGHLEVAKHALKELNVVAIWFVVARLSPFKENASSFDDRVAMVRKMVGPYKRFHVCTVEKTMPIPSYSIDTVRQLKVQNPTTEFYWLIGSDQLDALESWKDIDQLKREVTFVVYNREGYNALHSFKTIKGPLINVSSTDIRSGISTKTSRRVLGFSMMKGLYLDSMTKERLSEKRYQHTLRVTELALELAAIHNVDRDEVYLAAMTHDWCKELADDELISAMRCVNPELLKLNPALYHGFAASSLLSKQYFVRNRNVLRAISSHVVGSSTNKVAMILFIADKCERGRSYDTEPFIEIAKKDLVKGFKKVRLNSRNYVRRNHGIIESN